jgi:quercetin dioxygenase-like cupin family protein
MEAVTDEYYAALEAEEYAGRVVTAGNEFMFQRSENPITLATFNGPIYLSTVVGENNILGAPGIHYVVFEPGVINNWHIHAGGQILIATDGIGYHQIEGQPVEVLNPGDVALCPPGKKHWHGGSADTRFAHLAINTNPESGGLPRASEFLVEWLEPVSIDQ